MQVQENLSKKIQAMVNEMEQANDFGDYNHAKNLEEQIMEIMFVMDMKAIEETGRKMQ